MLPAMISNAGSNGWIWGVVASLAALPLVACESASRERGLPATEVELIHRAWAGDWVVEVGEPRFMRSDTRIDVRLPVATYRPIEARTLRVMAEPIAVDESRGGDPSAASNAVQGALRDLVAVSWSDRAREVPASLQAGATLDGPRVQISPREVATLRFDVVDAGISIDRVEHRSEPVVYRLELVSAARPHEALLVANPREGGGFAFDLSPLGVEQCGAMRDLLDAPLLLRVHVETTILGEDGRSRVWSFEPQTIDLDRMGTGATTPRAVTRRAAQERLREVAAQMEDSTLEVSWQASSEPRRGDPLPTLRIANAGPSPIVGFVGEIAVGIDGGEPFLSRGGVRIACLCPGEAQTIELEGTIDDPCSERGGDLAGVVRGRAAGLVRARSEARLAIRGLPRPDLRVGQARQEEDGRTLLLLVDNRGASPAAGLTLRVGPRNGVASDRVSVPLDAIAPGTQGLRVDVGGRNSDHWSRWRREGADLAVWIVDAARASLGCDDAEVAGPIPVGGVR